MSQGKFWCFTLNNYNEDNLRSLDALLADGKISYLVYGKEKGKEGTPHLQGYVEFPARLRFNSVTNALPRGCHIERRAGTAVQASDYCKKDGDFVEHGELSRVRPGQRNDILDAKRILDEGGSLKDCAEEAFGTYLRYSRSLTQYRQFKIPDRDWIVNVQIFWGDPGTGKTKSVYDKEETIYSHPGGAWFDGYDGQEAVLFDDFTGSCFRLQYLLKLLDRYPMQVPVKGGFVKWSPRRIYITSNLEPDDWYPNAREIHRTALRRRFTEVKQFSRLEQL